MNNICQILKECPAKTVAPNLVKLVTKIKENELKDFYNKYFIKDSLF